MIPGIAVPASAYSVDWKLDQCMLLGVGAFQFDGNVVVQVTDGAQGISAVVRPHRLRLTTSSKATELTNSFFVTSDRTADLFVPPLESP